MICTYIFQRFIERYLCDYTTYTDSTERRDFLSKTFDSYCRLGIHLYATVCEQQDNFETNLCFFLNRIVFNKDVSELSTLLSKCIVLGVLFINLTCIKTKEI